MLMSMYIVHAHAGAYADHHADGESYVNGGLKRYERSWLRAIKERLTLALKYLETRKKHYAKKRVKHVRNVVERNT